MEFGGKIGIGFQGIFAEVWARKKQMLRGRIHPLRNILYWHKLVTKCTTIVQICTKKVLTF